MNGLLVTGYFFPHEKNEFEITIGDRLYYLLHLVGVLHVTCRVFIQIAGGKSVTAARHAD